MLWFFESEFCVSRIPRISYPRIRIDDVQAVLLYVTFRRKYLTAITALDCREIAGARISVVFHGRDATPWTHMFSVANR